MKKFIIIIFLFPFFGFGQCDGLWSGGTYLQLVCNTGQWIGAGSPVPSCDPVPEYTESQTGTFTYFQPVNQSVITFSAFDNLNCSRIKVSVNGSKYFLTQENLSDNIFACASNNTVSTDDGYAIISSGNDADGASGSITIFKLGISSLMIQTNDANGTVFQVQPCSVLPLGNPRLNPVNYGAEKPLEYIVMDFTGRILYRGKELKVPVSMPVIIHEVYKHRVQVKKVNYLR